MEAGSIKQVEIREVMVGINHTYTLYTCIHVRSGKRIRQVIFERENIGLMKARGQESFEVF